MANFSLTSHVSTMTIHFAVKESTNVINLEELIHTFQTDRKSWDTLSSTVYDIRLTGVTKKNKRKNFKSFFNSISIVSHPTSKKVYKICAKLFKNGSIHCTGSKSIEEANKVASDIFQIVKVVCGYEYHIDTVNMQMMNIVCKMTCKEMNKGIPLNLSVFHAILNRDDFKSKGIISKYNPDSYCGLIVKLPISNTTNKKFRNGKIPMATILVFASGCFITSVRNHDDIAVVNDIFMKGILHKELVNIIWKQVAEKPKEFIL
jgi:TATA-box binding protein (TBP) (component of TFIID and TFIIIB)